MTHKVTSVTPKLERNSNAVLLSSTLRRPSEPKEKIYSRVSPCYIIQMIHSEYTTIHEIYKTIRFFWVNIISEPSSFLNNGCEL